MSDFTEADAEDLKRPGNRNRKPTGRMALTAQEGLPPGPYSVGLTHGPRGDGEPWTVCCGDGRAIAGSVHSKASAEAIAAALNYFADETIRMYVRAWIEGRIPDAPGAFKGQIVAGAGFS